MDSPRLRWSVDALVKRENTVFSYGWIFDPARSIERLALVLVDDGGATARLYTEYGRTRQEVAARFTRERHALRSGYFFYGTFPAAFSASRRIRLQCTYSDGTVESVEISRHLAGQTERDRAAAPRRVMRTLRRQAGLLKRGLLLLKGGRWRQLYDKAKNYRRAVATPPLNDAAAITHFFTPQQCEKVIFILDHDLGGGANQYRQRQVEQKLAEGFVVLTLVFDVSTLTYQLLLATATQRWRCTVPDTEFVLALADHVHLHEIIYNTGVAFIQPEALPAFLLALKAKTGAALTVLAHDFFPVCPSHFLLNDRDRYCAIPTDPAVCRACLRNHTRGFTALYPSGDIEAWRAQWGALLTDADRLIFFSQSTRNLYRRVWPQLSAPGAQVIPHKVDYLPRRAVIRQQTRPCIGIVGHIGFHKGAEIVKALALENQRRGSPARIVVIGTLDSDCPPDLVTQTGSYQREKLADQLERQGVSIVLFPSRCPETFSYVVHEMIALGYPTACFDLGAQAERLRSYEKGCVLTTWAAEEMLPALLDFHHRSYPSLARQRAAIPAGGD